MIIMVLIIINDMNLITIAVKINMLTIIFKYDACDEIVDFRHSCTLLLSTNFIKCHIIAHAPSHLHKMGRLLPAHSHGQMPH